jgi:hypothetical protein
MGMLRGRSISFAEEKGAPREALLLFRDRGNQPRKRSRSPLSLHKEMEGGRTLLAEDSIGHGVAKRVIITLLFLLALQVALGQSLGLRLGYAPNEGLAFGGSWTASEIGNFRFRIVLDLVPKVTGAFVGYDTLVRYTLFEGEAYVGIGLGGLMATFGTFGTTLTVGLAFPGLRPTPFAEAIYIYGLGENARLWRFILGLGGTLAESP